MMAKLMDFNDDVLDKFCSRNFAKMMRLPARVG
jgi:hypothetical protein